MTEKKRRKATSRRKRISKRQKGDIWSGVPGPRGELVMQGFHAPGISVTLDADGELVELDTSDLDED